MGLLLFLFFFRFGRIFKWEQYRLQFNYYLFYLGILLVFFIFIRMFFKFLVWVGSVGRGFCSVDCYFYVLGIGKQYNNKNFFCQRI